MRFPDLIWEPTLKGANSGLVPRRFAQNFTTSAAALSVIADTPTVSLESALIVTNVILQAIAGAAQTVTAANLQIRVLENNATIVGVSRDLPGTLEFNRTFTDLELVVMPGEILRFTADFSAAANPNTAFLGVHGWVINRGNFQY